MVQAALMCGHHITQRGTLVKHIVPAKGIIRLARTRLEMYIRHQPRSVAKIRKVSGRLIAIGADDMPGDELRRCEDDVLCSVSAKLTFSCAHGNDLDARPLG